MADNEIFTEEMMRVHARDVLEEWVDGYTDVLGDGRQRRITIDKVDDSWIYVRVQRQNMHGGYDRQDQHYKITIDVKEVEDGAED